LTARHIRGNPPTSASPAKRQEAIQLLVDPKTGLCSPRHAPSAGPHGECARPLIQHYNPKATFFASAWSAPDNVVYRSGADNFVAVLGNSNSTDSTVRVVLAGKSFVVKVPANSFATYRWKQPVSVDRHNTAPVLDHVPDVVADQYSTVQVPLKATDRDGDRLAIRKGRDGSGPSVFGNLGTDGPVDCRQGRAAAPLRGSS
jgi:hypothetical protein